MIKKMPTYTPICNICKQIAQTIPKIERVIDSIKQQKTLMNDSDPLRLKAGQEGLQIQIDLYSEYLKGLKESYQSILGVEYGSKQTHEVNKLTANEYISSTLYRRGITAVKCTDSKNRDGWTSLHWKEVVEE